MEGETEVETFLAMQIGPGIVAGMRVQLRGKLIEDIGHLDKIATADAADVSCQAGDTGGRGFAAELVEGGALFFYCYFDRSVALEVLEVVALQKKIVVQAAAGVGVDEFVIDRVVF